MSDLWARVARRGGSRSQTASGQTRDDEIERKLAIAEREHEALRRDLSYIKDALQQELNVTRKSQRPPSQQPRRVQGSGTGTGSN